MNKLPQGPWKVKTVRIETREIAYEEYHIVHEDDDGMLIGVVDPISFDGGERDAELMADAPDLLDLVERVCSEAPFDREKWLSDAEEILSKFGREVSGIP